MKLPKYFGIRHGSAVIHSTGTAMDGHVVEGCSHIYWLKAPWFLPDSRALTLYLLSFFQICQRDKELMHSCCFAPLFVLLALIQSACILIIVASMAVMEVLQLILSPVCGGNCLGLHEEGNGGLFPRSVLDPVTLTKIDRDTPGLAILNCCLITEDVADDDEDEETAVKENKEKADGDEDEVMAVKEKKPKADAKKSESHSQTEVMEMDV
jgi:hypothetical protein